MKKILLFLVLITVILSIFSCGKNQTSKNENTPGDLSDTDTHSVPSGTDEGDTSDSTADTAEEIEIITPAEPSNLTVGEKTYDQLLVYNANPDNGYTEKFIQLAELFMSIGVAEVTLEEANLVITDDISSVSADDEWAVAAKNGKIYIAGTTRYAIDVAYVEFQDIISDMKGKYVFEEKVLAKGKLPSKEDFLETEQLVIYPEFDSRVNRIYDYKVTVSQRNLSAEIPVYNHSMEYALTSRSVGGDVFRRFAHFAFSGEMTRIDIRVGTDFDYYSILPTAKDFDTEYNDGVITVYLDEPDYFAIRLDGNDATILSVFADYPEYPLEVPDKGDENVYYIDDWYETENGIWLLSTPDTTIYIAPGAVVNARIKFEKGSTNAKVIGRGAIIDPYGNLNKTDIRIGGTEGAGYKMVIFSSDNWLYDGPVCIDARCFNILMSGSNGVIRNYKAVSSMMNTDGITIGGKNHLVEHCFMYVGDNGLVISNATNTVFRDITIGTTCAAIFPQLTNTGILLEDIYIFRSNDGILNNFYNNDNTTARKAEITIKNLDCVDCINLPHFFRGEKVGELDKVYNFINVSLPSICGSSDPHNSWMTNTKRLVLMKNTDGTLFTQNYTLNFTNLYIDGSAVKSKEDILIEDKWENTYTFNNDGTYKPGFCKTYEANSTADDKVYLGSYQVYFDADIVREAGTVYLPADEVLHMLLVDSKPATVKIGDISYVSLDALEAASAIEGYAVTSSGIYLIPVQNGQNLLFPEEGEVSHFSEINCYQVDLVLEFEDGNPVYYMHNYKNRNTGGISRFIHNELKMYGQGKYEFTFKIKGSGDGTVNIATMYDTTMSSTKKTSSLSVSEDWDSYTVTIDATSDIISCESFFISITGTSDAPLDYFVIKDFRLTKVS